MEGKGASSHRVFSRVEAAHLISQHKILSKDCFRRDLRDSGVAVPSPPYKYLGYLKGLRMLLVEAEYCREELRELFFQLLTRKQVAHGTQSRHHCKPELKRQQRLPVCSWL